MFVLAEVAVQPLPSVMVTLYGPSTEATIVCVVSPEFHKYAAAVGAVRTTEPPAQNVVGPFAVTVATGAGFIVTVNGAEVAEQPSALVTVTVTVCVEASVTLCVNAPLDHAYDAPVEATSVTDAPWQNVFPLSDVMFATGLALTTTEVTAEVAEHPFAFVTVTVTSEVLFTVIDCVVAHVLHKYEEPAFAVSVTEPP